MERYCVLVVVLLVLVANGMWMKLTRRSTECRVQQGQDLAQTVERLNQQSYLRGLLARRKAAVYLELAFRLPQLRLLHYCVACQVVDDREEWAAEVHRLECLGA